MSAYAGFLQYGDEQIGRLLDFLKTTGLEDNTLVVLLSDNGPASETKTGWLPCSVRRPDHAAVDG
jgi:arylsulfatase A-like enzyme